MTVFYPAKIPRNFDYAVDVITSKVNSEALVVRSLMDAGIPKWDSIRNKHEVRLQDLCVLAKYMRELNNKYFNVEDWRDTRPYDEVERENCAQFMD